LKVLLDNCVPRPFERALIGHDVTHCSRLGWERLTNGRLLAAAEQAGFEVFVTVDQGIRYQQTMIGRTLSIIFIRSVKNDMPTLTPLASTVLKGIGTVEPGKFLVVTAEDGI
jgi:hypothetical protein